MKNKKQSSFWRKYAVVTIIVMILIQGGLVVFYDFMTAYERSQPNSAADEYASNLTIAEIEEWIDSTAANLNHPFDSAKAVADACKTAVNSLDGGFTCERDYASSTLNSPKYTVLCGDVAIGSITLTEQSGGKYGFSQWIVTETAASLTYPGAPEITRTIYAPQGSKVEVNGIVLDESYRVYGNSQYANRNLFESGEIPGVDQYRISGIYSSPSITCSINGEECVSQILEDAVCFFAQGSGFVSCTISAPTGSDVKINGVLVDKSYIIAAGITYEYSVFEPTSDNLPTYDVYAVGGLFNAPKVTAMYKGKEMTVTDGEDGLYTAQYPAELTYTVQLKVPQGSAVTLRGLSCEAWKSESVLAYPDLFENTSSHQSYDVYSITGLYNAIEEATVVYQGKELPITVSTSEQLIEISALYPYTDNEAVSKLAMTFAKDYFRYMSNGYNNIDWNLGQALSHVVYGSDLYNRILNSRNGVWYVTPITSEDVKKFEITDMRLMGDGSVVCTIEFDIDQLIYYVTRKYSGKMTVLAVNTYNSWKISSMHLEND